MRVFGDSNAIEQQQLQIGQGSIRKKALLVLAIWPEQGEAERSSIGVQLTILDNVWVGRMIEQACIWHQALLTGSIRPSHLSNMQALSVTCHRTQGRNTQYSGPTHQESGATVTRLRPLQMPKTVFYEEQHQ